MFFHSTTFLFCSLFITSCSLHQTPVQSGNTAQILHLGNYAEPQDLDPHIITGVTELNIISALLEGLVIEDPQDLHPIPGVAQTWQSSPDGMTWTFNLRHNARWSNGDVVTASDFLYSFKRMLSPALGAEYSYMLYCMKNGEAYNRGSITDFSMVGAKAIDSFTLVIELQKPTPYFLSLLSHNSWLPIHPATIEKFGKIDERGTQWTRPENFVGNGPFSLTEWIQNKIISVTKSPTYWDSATVKLNKICFYPIESAQTEERAFRSGMLHVSYTIPPAKIEVYRKNQPQLLRIDPYLATYYYLLNINKAPFTDKKVCRSLAMAIDKKAIVENITRGGEIGADFFTPPNTAGYTTTARLPYDTISAQKLLADAGFPGGKGFPPIEILYNTSEKHHLIAQAIQQMWQKNLGITVTLLNQEWKVYLDAQKRKNYTVSRAGWTGDYNDPTTFLDMWVTGGGNNRAGWSNHTYDSLITLAAAEQNIQKRYGYFNEAETILLDEAPVVPVYFYTSAYLIVPSVKGWYPTILNHHPYKFIYLENDVK